MVIGTTALSIVGNIIGCRAKTIETLIAANACNGVAAAGQLSFGIVLGELVPNKQRGPIVTLVFASSLPFSVFGPIIARKFIDSTEQKWRWSYYLGIIFGVITIALYQFLYHPPTYSQLHVNGKTKWQAFKELDFIGIFLFIAGCVLFLIGLSWGGSVYPWVSAEVLSTIIIGIFTLIAFGLYGMLLQITHVRFRELTSHRAISLQDDPSHATTPVQERRIRRHRRRCMYWSHGILLDDYTLANNSWHRLYNRCY